MSYYVYILECANKNYYTGYTTDPNRRYQEHKKGTHKCRYTRSFPPTKLAAVWEFETKSDALRAECYIKKLTKQQKIRLIEEKTKLWFNE